MTDLRMLAERTVRRLDSDMTVTYRSGRVEVTRSADPANLVERILREELGGEQANEN